MESVFSVRYRFTMNGIFELPIGKGKLFAGSASGLKQLLLGGWTLNPMLEFRSVYPFSVLDGVSISDSGGSSTGLPDRPNMLRGDVVQGGIQQYFDPKVYALQNIGFLGNSPRSGARLGFLCA